MTIAQQLKIKEFPFKIKDSRGQEIYREDENGFWLKQEYDARGNVIYWENFTGYWSKSEYDAYGNQTYWENATGYWHKREYDANGIELYYENSDGYIYGKPKTIITMDEIAAKFGIPVETLKIKK